MKKIKLLIILIFSILLVLLAIDNYGIWTDETYSLNMIKNSFKDIFYIAKNLDDNIFYMICLKSFILIFNVTTPKNIVIMSRIFSVIPIILLFLIGDKKISEIHSEKHGLTFIVGIFVSTIISYSIEIRVYSWTILFVTLAYIYFLKIVKNNDKTNWLIFIICSSVAFWFHKITVIPLGFLYVYLFFETLKEKEVKTFFKCFFITVLICVPWVLWSFYLNMDSLSESYVVGAIMPIFSYSKITETIVFPFNTGNLYLSLAYIVFIGTFFIYYIYLNYKNLDFHVFFGLFVLPLTIISLMLIAYISNHDYYPKYMLPSLGVFFTSISIMISNNKYNKQLIGILLAFNLITYFNIFRFEQKSKEGFIELENYMNNNIKDETIIFNFDYGKYIIEYYQFDGLKDNELIWDLEFIEKPNSLYLIQTNKLDEYFKDNDFEMLKEFNISHDLFSLCKLNIQ